MVLFEPFLGIRDRRRIYHAWEQYCHPRGIPKNENEKRNFKFNDYASIEDEKGKNEAKEVALKKIDKILSFAKPMQHFFYSRSEAIRHLLEEALKRYEKKSKK